MSSHAASTEVQEPREIDSVLSGSRIRVCLLLYLLLLAIATVGYGWHNAFARNEWAMAEWLINYSGGFVRRGFVGEIILLASRGLHANPLYLVLLLQLLAYAVFFVCVYRLTNPIRWSYAILAILVSPATLAFQVLDPPGGFRKEILLFAAMGLLAVQARRLSSRGLALFLVVSTQVLLLSHEPLLVYLPYLFALVFLHSRSPRQTALLCLPAAVLSLVTFALVSHFRGDLSTAASICSSLGSQLAQSNQGLCGGAVLWIGQTSRDARQLVALSIEAFHYWSVYPIVLLLAAAPFGLWAWSARKDPELTGSLRILAVAAGLSLTGSILLFIVAADWGRWIYIHAVCLMIVILAAENRRAAACGHAGAAPEPLALRPIPLFLVLAYGFFWTLPHIALFPGRFGYIDLWRYLHSYSSFHPSPPRV